MSAALALPIMPAPAAIVVMGVSGCGKSTVGGMLAECLAARFADGDAFHPPENVAKMASGQPLTDADRWPWLAAIGAWMAERNAAGEGVVVACSALRRVYRDRLRAACPGLRFVFLRGEMALIAPRQAARKGHYMPPSLLASQFATLEEPAPDEAVITVSVAPAAEAVLAAVLDALEAEQRARGECFALKGGQHSGLRTFSARSKRGAARLTMQSRGCRLPGVLAHHVQEAPYRPSPVRGLKVRQPGL